MAIQFRTSLRNTMANDISTDAGANSVIRIYSGTPPANPGTALSGNTLLGTLNCGATFAPAAVGGVLTANAISNDISADADGTATFFRLLQSDLTTVVMQGTVGTSSADMIVNSVAFVTGGTISITSCVLTAPGA